MIGGLARALWRTLRRRAARFPATQIDQCLCPICDGAAFPFGEVDFNKCCEERRGTVLPPAGIRVAYWLCDVCGFCFAPEFTRWTSHDFATKIYNSGYVVVDPDYIDVRPRANADVLIRMFGKTADDIRHLDYGAGAGLLSELLRRSGWESAAYDPFMNTDTRADSAAPFDLITAYEVFEHVPDVRGLLQLLSSLLDRNGVMLFSTLVSDGNLNRGEPLDWWYAAPRNGHVSLFSTKSLSILGARAGFSFGSISSNFHAYWRTVPAWATHIIRVDKPEYVES